MNPKVLKKGGPVLRFLRAPRAAHGGAMFRHACALGLEGIVSKKVTGRYKSGRCPRGGRSRTRHMSAVHEVQDLASAEKPTYYARRRRQSSIRVGPLRGGRVWVREQPRRIASGSERRGGEP